MVVFVRENRQVYRWEGEQRDGDKLVRNEIMWVILGGHKDLAIGVLYMGGGVYQGVLDLRI